MLICGGANSLAISHAVTRLNSKLKRVGSLKQKDNRWAEVKVAEEFALLEMDGWWFFGCELMVSVVTRRPRTAGVRRQSLQLDDKNSQPGWYHDQRFFRTEHFSRGSPQTTRMSSGISCQPSVTLNLRLDCVVLDNIQQSMRELIVIKISHCIWTKSLAVISVPSYCIMHALYTVVCLCNPAFVKGCQSPINVCFYYYHCYCYHYHYHYH